MTTLTIMTYNLSGDLKTWPKRKPAMGALFSGVVPDILCTQEAQHVQMDLLDRKLPDHKRVTHRSGSGRRQFHNTIYYDADLLELRKTGQYWLSRGSRHVVWARFKLQNGMTFLVLNTHLDHKFEWKRARQAKKLLEGKPGDTRGIIAGDFNSHAGSKSRNILEAAGWRDTWKLAEERGPEVSSWNGYKDNKPSTKRVDAILVRREKEVFSAEVVASNFDGQFPSDHSPVIARLNF